MEKPRCNLIWCNLYKKNAFIVAKDELCVYCSKFDANDVEGFYILTPSQMERIKQKREEKENNSV
jgi:hypothetical protein